jgi:hypothetical protein
MAEKEEVIVAVPATSLVSSDCKRKFEDLLHSQPTESNTDGVETEDDVNKRPRLDDDNRMTYDLGTTQHLFVITSFFF